jgi:predicted nucleic acid-binding protein
VILLADTSVWIEHFRKGRPQLAAVLAEGLVLMHPFIYGELACGNLKDRSVVLSHLKSLPAAKVATHSETLQLLDRHRLWGLGLGWLDVNLLASALLSDCLFWTLDKPLARAAASLGVGFTSPVPA